MGSDHSNNIHPTAVVGPEVKLGADVEIGPFCVLEGQIELGDGCVLKPYVHVIGKLKMGKNNQVFSGAVIGEKPQHLKYANEPTGVEIGDNNLFRENCTVHRGTTHSWTTRIGSNNFFMAGAHIAHDCTVGSNCLFANNALLGGHCTIEDNVYISGNSGVHQFVRIGRLAMLSGCSGTARDQPPFIIQQGFTNVVGVNVIGMRRAGMSNAEITAVRKAYRILYMEGNTIPIALAKIESELGEYDAIREFADFVKNSKNGIARKRAREADIAA